MEKTVASNHLDVLRAKSEELGKAFDAALKRNVDLAELKKIFQEMKKITDEIEENMKRLIV